MKAAVLVVTVFLLVWLSPAGPVSVRVRAQTACPLHASGLTRVAEGNEEAALNDFRDALNSCSLEFKVDALVQAGNIYLRRMPIGSDSARTVVNALRSSSFGDLGNARALVLNGRIRLLDDPQPDEIQNALRDFEQARALDEGTKPESWFYAGDALRLTSDESGALSAYREVIKTDPTSVWGARALLGAARCYVRSGQIDLALANLQQVRRRFPTLPEADQALDWSTILNRLYLRAQSGDIYAHPRQFDEPKADVKAVVGMVVDATGQVSIAHKGGWVRFNASGKYQDADVSTVTEFDVTAMGRYGPQSLAVAREGEGTVTLDRTRTPFWKLQVPTRGGGFKIPAIRALAVTPWEELIFTDGETKSLYKVRRSGTPKVLGAITGIRVILNERYDIAVLDDASRAIRIIKRDQGSIISIAARAVGPGTTQDLGEPGDIAFDGLGYLYVLDKRGHSVHVLTPALTPIGTFLIPRQGMGVTGGLSLMALDSAARLYLFDEGSKRIWVYQ